jgi:DNA-binding winged helix-turn-helix (wHTH) protein/tetratricopeptide (TPR) repeat protein
VTQTALSDTLEFNGFRLHPRLRVLEDLTGAPVQITAKALDALLCFVQRPGEVISRAELMDTLWPNSVVEENNLTQTIAALRRAIGEETIVTVPRRGYQLTAVVQAAATFADSAAERPPARPDAKSTARTTPDAPLPPATSTLSSRLGQVVVAALVLVVAFIVADIYLLPSGSSDADGVPIRTDSARTGGSRELTSDLPAPPEVSTRPPTDVRAAYAAYERARGALEENGWGRNEFAYDQLTLAIEADSEFMLAHLYRGLLGFLRSRSEMNALLREEPNLNLAAELIEQARRDAERALQLDPQNGYAHALAGVLSLVDNDAESAQGSFDRALLLAPDDPDVINFVAASYLGQGRRDEAHELLSGLVDEVLLAQRFAEAFVLAGHDDPRPDMLFARIEIDPDDGEARMLAGLLSASHGEYARALAELQLAEEFLDLDTPRRFLSRDLAMLIYAYGRIGRTTDAQRLFAKFERLDHGEPPAGAVAWLEVYLGLGDLDRAYEWAELIADTPRPPFVTPQLHFMYNTYLDPRLDESRFLALRRRMGYRD